MTNQKKIIAILTKSPHSVGRVGGPNSQDWYVQCEEVSKFFNSNNVPGVVDWFVAVTSALHVKGARREEEYYYDSLRFLGIRESNLLFYGQGVETSEQLEVYKRLQEEWQADIILSVTWTHYLRVKYLAQRVGLKVERYLVSGGIPRPKEFFTDFALTLIFPVLDFIGLWGWFIERAKARRHSGKF